MASGVVLMMAVLGGATLFGLWRIRMDGRARRVDFGVITAPDLGRPLPKGVTLLQFSSAHCQPCRKTRDLLSAVSREIPHVTHVEIDAAEYLDLTKRLGILRTPTTLILDSGGAIRARVSGQPRMGEIVSTLATLTRDPSLSTPINDGDLISIIPAVAGG